MIKAIDTIYKGYRFRSRLEARWAVFFNEAGIKYEYETEGFVLSDGTWYLPDFWLPDAVMWLEIKSTSPSPDETNKCHLLAIGTGRDVLLAIGSPSADSHNIIGYHKSGSNEPVNWECPHIFDCGALQIQADRRNDGEFWLVDVDGSSVTKIISVSGSKDHDRYPVISSALLAAYTASRQARFEHGQFGAPLEWSR